ncbi:hypothetical protein, partial [Marinifilum flexuosum]|uniref:hypothetical protein n=1 Tax=Marinifilum flexuosum TaxID=1117708 RepID=UPI002491DEE5
LVLTFVIYLKLIKSVSAQNRKTARYTLAVVGVRSSLPELPACAVPKPVSACKVKKLPKHVVPLLFLFVAPCFFLSLLSI